MSKRGLIHGDDFDATSLRGKPSDVGSSEMSLVPICIVIAMVCAILVAIAFI